MYLVSTLMLLFHMSFKHLNSYILSITILGRLRRLPLLFFTSRKVSWIQPIIIN